MQQDSRLAQLGSGRALTLLATASTNDVSRWQCLYPPLPPEPAGLMYWGKALCDEESFKEGLGTGVGQAGVLGLACLDSFGDKIPPKFLMELHRGLDGRVGWSLRQGLAYVSNVAVAPEARRQGVARKLVREAERHAREWGCRGITLHVDPGNTPAYELYRSLGYRNAVLEPEWMPYLMGRPQERRWLMIKWLGRSSSRR